MISFLFSKAAESYEAHFMYLFEFFGININTLREFYKRFPGSGFFDALNAFTLKNGLDPLLGLGPLSALAPPWSWELWELYAPQLYAPLVPPPHRGDVHNPPEGAYKTNSVESTQELNIEQMV